jgi:hypothetical protein
MNVDPLIIAIKPDIGRTAIEEIRQRDQKFPHLRKASINR